MSVENRGNGHAWRMSANLGPLHMSPVGGRNFVFCSYRKFNPGYRDGKCPKGPQNTLGTAFRLVSDLSSHAQLKMFRHGQSRYPGWSVHMGEISISVTEISVNGPARLLIRTHARYRRFYTPTAAIGENSNRCTGHS